MEKCAHAHTHIFIYTHTHTQSDSQFIMSVMRCEYNSLMIIICTVTLQRLKIGKRVTAVKLWDSLTGSNMVRSFVYLCVRGSEREGAGGVGRVTGTEGMSEYVHLLLFMRISSKVCWLCELFLVFRLLRKKKKNICVVSCAYHDSSELKMNMKTCQGDVKSQQMSS